jgi:hypothetical protein
MQNLLMLKMVRALKGVQHENATRNLAHADVQRDYGSKVGLRRAVIAFLVQMNTGRLGGRATAVWLGTATPRLV